MGLSNDLVSMFVKATKDDTKQKVESTIYGTTVMYNDAIYVKLDGADQLTPVLTTTDIKPDERVMVTIRNHTAVIVGNMTSPSITLQTTVDGGDGNTIKLSELGMTVVDGIVRIRDLETNSLTANSGIIKDLQTNSLTAESAIIKDLQANSLTADSAIIKDLQTNSLTAESAIIVALQTESLTAESAIIKELQTNSLTSESAIIKNLQTDKLDVKTANITYATISSLEATDLKVSELTATYGNFETVIANKFTAVDASIEQINADKLSVNDADIKYANIDFANIGEAAIKKIYSDVGIIKDLVMDNGHVTGDLIGVRIKGDLIEAETLKADRLIVLGSDGNYYKINTDFTAIPGVEPVEEDQISGSALVAESVTAEKIYVEDLHAFGATIGGFNIGEDALYSGEKTTVDNTTSGIYLDSSGQFHVGDTNNFIKFYKDSDKFKMVISAETILFGIDGTDNTDFTIGDASKVATDYLKRSAESGIIIGDLTSDTLGNNVFIDNNSVDIRDGTDVLASYTANKIELGRNNKRTTIDLCNGTAEICNIADYDTDYNRLQISSEDSIDLIAHGGIYINTTDYGQYGDKTYANLILQSNSPWISDSQVTEMAGLSASTHRDGGNIHISEQLSFSPYSIDLRCAYKVFDPSYVRTPGITIYGRLGNTDIDGNQTDPSEWYSATEITSDKVGISNDLEVIGKCTIGKVLDHTGLQVYGTTTISDVCNILDDLNVGGTEKINGDIYMATNNTAIYGNKPDVGQVEVLVPQDSGGNLLIGREVYKNGRTGKTKIYGYDIYICPYRPDLTNGVEYKPYYARGDSISITPYDCGGYISNSSKSVYFSIPVSKPILGNPTVTIDWGNNGGLAVRQNSNYCYGANSNSQYIKPSSYTAALNGDGSYIRVTATMPNTTNAINNEACGISASLTISFS